MDNILRDEVNQHTSDEVEKVLAELEAQGVDLTAIKEALANAGGAVKSVQHGTLVIASSKNSGSVSISAVDPAKTFVVPMGSYLGTSDTGSLSASGRWNTALALSSDGQTVTGKRCCSPSYTATTTFCVVELM